MANIIIVEDDFKVADIYKKRLEEDGHKVEIIDDTGALDKIKSQKPDVVLLDLLMPKISGMTILRELKSDPNFEEIPVLILTNVEGTNELSQAIALGACAYLVKAETNIDILSAKVKEVIESEAIATGVKS